MCVQNEEDEYNGLFSSYRCGMCYECLREQSKLINKEKRKNDSCGNCGYCEECCN
jgi:hypothetical protein